MARRVVWIPSSTQRMDEPTRVPFGDGVSAPFAARISRAFRKALHLRLTVSSIPVRRPAWGCPATNPCPWSFARLITRPHVQVGTPGYHRVSHLHGFGCMSIPP